MGEQKTKSIEMGHTSPSNPLYEARGGEGESSGMTMEQREIRNSENRKCRDVLFLLLFFLYALGMLIIAGYGYKNGDPVVLIYGPDYNGNICNQDSVRSKGSLGFQSSHRVGIPTVC